MCEAISLSIPLQWLAMLALSIPVFLLLWPFFYDTWDQFLEALRYAYQPGWLSLLRGEFTSDVEASLRFWAFVLVCLIPVGLGWLVGAPCLA